jgi:hypothetical protein
MKYQGLTFMHFFIRIARSHISNVDPTSLIGDIMKKTAQLDLEGIRTAWQLAPQLVRDHKEQSVTEMLDDLKLDDEADARNISDAAADPTEAFNHLYEPPTRAQAEECVAEDRREEVRNVRDALLKELVQGRSVQIALDLIGEGDPEDHDHHISVLAHELAVARRYGQARQIAKQHLAGDPHLQFRTRIRIGRIGRKELRELRKLVVDVVLASPRESKFGVECMIEIWGISGEASDLERARMLAAIPRSYADRAITWAYLGRMTGERGCYLRAIQEIVEIKDGVRLLKALDEVLKELMIAYHASRAKRGEGTDAYRSLWSIFPAGELTAADFTEIRDWLYEVSTPWGEALDKRTIKLDNL